MGMKTDLIDVLFKSKLRAKLLGVMVLNPDKMFYVNQLARQLDSSEGSVHRQLTSLHASELLLREEDGNRVYFRINDSVPIYEDLRNLLLKTVALRDVIFEALDSLSSDISLAFIYYKDINNNHLALRYANQAQNIDPNNFKVKWLIKKLK